MPSRLYSFEDGTVTKVAEASDMASRIATAMPLEGSCKRESHDEPGGIVSDLQGSQATLLPGAAAECLWALLPLDG